LPSRSSTARISGRSEPNDEEAGGDPEAAARRLVTLKGIPRLEVTESMRLKPRVRRADRWNYSLIRESQ
jgi:hypothetical protein